MTEKKSLRIGIIGCGRVTETLHLPALQQLAEVKVISLADINPDALNRVANRFHIQRRYTDYHALLENPLIDIIAVCVPAQFHIEIALSALDAGKHLFVEKPLALSLEDCARLIEKAEKVNQKSTVGFNLRCHRLIQEAQKMIRQGALGTIEAIRSNWTSAIRNRQNVPAWRNRRDLGGGVLFEIAVHHFDLWRFLLQSEVEQVYALSRSEEWLDETATVTARMANGVIATSVFSERTSDHNELEIYGRKGRLPISLYRYDGLEFYSISTEPGGIATRLKKLKKGLTELPKGISIMRQGGDFQMSYRFEWQHFINAIQNGLPVKSSLEDGMRSLQIILAVIESASIGMPVKVTNATRTNTPM